jgi:hypothetical protein
MAILDLSDVKFPLDVNSEVYRNRPIRLTHIFVIAALDPTLIMHLDEGWHLHQPATLRQGGFHKSGMRPFPRQT